MIATLEYNNGYYCSNCKMRHRSLHPYCDFCGADFSNFSSYIYQQTKKKEDDAMLDEYYYDDFDYNDIYKDK